MDFNEARMYETALNLHTHARILHACISSVDSKQHLSEVVFCALVGFSLKGKWRYDWSSAAASHFPNKLGEGQVKTIQKTRNQTPVVIVEAFHVTKTKEGLPSAQQCQSDADCFLWLRGVAHHKYAP